MTEERRYSTAETLAQIDGSWQRLMDTIGTLNDEQLDGPTDAGGWTVKDHLIHLAVWEDGVDALLNGGTRYDAMGIAESMWRTYDWDVVNALIQTRTRDIPLNEALTRLRTGHEKLVASISRLPDDRLYQPYIALDPGAAGDDRHLIDVIAGNTWEHYDEHEEWITTLVGM